MAVYSIARYEVRPDAREAAERAMHDFAAFVRKELPDATWTAYRDPASPSHYTAMLRADTPAAEERCTKAFAAAIAPHLAGVLEASRCELVTSSDLQRRHRR
jgi:hypothetical protein